MNELTPPTHGSTQVAFSTDTTPFNWRGIECAAGAQALRDQDRPAEPEAADGISAV